MCMVLLNRRGTFLVIVNIFDAAETWLACVDKVNSNTAFSKSFCKLVAEFAGTQTGKGSATCV